MTDKEKAKELVINVMANRHFESNGMCQRKQIENALKEMAEWKDRWFEKVLLVSMQQIKEFHSKNSKDDFEKYLDMLINALKSNKNE